MACTASVLRFPSTGEALPFFSQYDRAGSAGTDLLTHDVSIVPDARVPTVGISLPTPSHSRAPPSGFRYQPPVIAGHIVQSLVECKARAVVF